jgi:type II secretory pathway predicted ATPase ExeA/cell division protein FtsN
MFEKHFGLRENPFIAGHQHRFVYPSPEHLEALAHLRYGIENREPFILITGEVGTGKTTALYDALAEWESRVVVALITNSALTRNELLEEIALRFGVVVPPGSSKPQLMTALERHLLEVRARQHRAILLLDEAQNLERELLEEIRLLSNLETGGDNLLQVVLVGQPELEERLGRPELRQLRQRITVHYRLNPLSMPDTERYIHHRVTVAGGHALSIFPAEPCRAIHHLTGGIPREINHVAAQAMLTAYVEDARSVRVEHVESAASEIEFRSVLRRTTPSHAPPPAPPAAAPEARGAQAPPTPRAAEPPQPRPAQPSPQAPAHPPEPPAQEPSPPAPHVGPPAAASPTPPPPPAPPTPASPEPSGAPTPPGGWEAWLSGLPQAGTGPAAPPPSQAQPAARPAAPPARPRAESTRPSRPSEVPAATPPPPAARPAAHEAMPPVPSARAGSEIERLGDSIERRPPGPDRSRAASGHREPVPGSAPSERREPEREPATLRAAPAARRPEPPPLPPRLREKLERESADAERSVRSPMPWLIGLAVLAAVVVTGSLWLRYRKAPTAESTPASTAVQSESPAAATTPNVDAPAESTLGSTPSAPPAAATTTGASLEDQPGPRRESTSPMAGAPAPSPATPPMSAPVATPAALAERPMRYGVVVRTYLARERAEEERTRLAGASGLPSRVLAVSEGGTEVYRVVLGLWESRPAAERAASDLIGSGLVNEARVVSMGRAPAAP